MPGSNVCSVRSASHDSCVRPVGSTDGRRPDSGYPALEPMFGAFMAGFIEGEATFGIRKQPRNTNHSCYMTLKVRDDDAELLRDFAKTTRIGTVTNSPARCTSQPQASWNVGAKADCVRLVSLLMEYPLRGRKGRDFAIWAAAVDWWVGDDATIRRKGRDWTPMIYLKRRLSDSKRYVEPTAQFAQPLDSPDWLPFLSGFLCADGTFGISRTGGGFQPAAQIAVRLDDRPLLESFRAITGVGNVYLPACRDGWNPTVLWRIVSRADLAQLIDVLDQFEPRGRRAAEYRIWRKAVIAYCSGRPPARIRPALRRYRAELDVLRTYSATRAA
jgi:hypothetical protein